MKSIHKLITIALIIATCFILESCANARVAGGVGVDVDFGPNGPRVRPSLNVNVYNGGHF